MADPNDVAGTKMARSVFGRRGIDLGMADMRVMHGVLYLRGVVSAVKGSDVKDVRAEVEHVAKILRTKPEIRDVVIDCQFRGA